MCVVREVGGRDSTITAPSLHVISRHIFVWRADLFCLEPSLHHHCTITAPSLHHHCTKVLFVNQQRNEGDVEFFSLLRERCHHHCTITAPSLHHRCTLREGGGFAVEVIDGVDTLGLGAIHAVMASRV